MANGNSAFIDLQIRATNTAVGDTDQDLIVARHGPGNFADTQLMRGCENHCSHRKNVRQTAVLTPFVDPATLLGIVVLTILRNSVSVSNRLCLSEKSFTADTTRMASSSVNCTPRFSSPFFTESMPLPFPMTTFTGDWPTM